MHPSQLESLVKQRQAELQHAARRGERSTATTSKHGWRRTLKMRHIGLLLIRFGEWVAGPESPSHALRPYLARQVDEIVVVPRRRANL